MMNLTALTAVKTVQPQFGNFSAERKEALKDRLYQFVEAQLPQAEKTVESYNDGRYSSDKTNRGLQAAQIVLNTAATLIANDIDLIA